MTHPNIKIEKMDTKRLHSSLKLGYAPISNYEFYHLKQENIVQQILADSTLYVICQREELTFENITYDNITCCLNFEIHKKGNNTKLSCNLCIYQENIEPFEGKIVATEFGRNKKGEIPRVMPINDIKGIRFYRDNVNGEFLLWISPDKFLHHYWNGILKATVIGDYREFTKFKVHYVGESTDQKIWDRLTGHDKLQDILSIEDTFHIESINTHEIVLLLFKIENAESVTIYDGTGDIDTFIESLINPRLPSKTTITLDVEKALIKLLKPSKKYNKIQYKQYPKSKDGLYNEGFNWVSYKIYDNVTLQYSNVEIIGSVDVLESTTIIVEENKTLRIE